MTPSTVPGTPTTSIGIVIGFGGINVIVACEVLVESAELVTIRRTVCCVLTDAGAVYTPIANEPIVGNNDQEAPVLFDPVMETLN